MGRFDRNQYDEDPPVVPGTNMRNPKPLFQPNENNVPNGPYTPKSPSAPVVPQNMNYGNASGYSGSSGAPTMGTATANTEKQTVKSNEQLAQEAMAELLAGNTRDTTGDEATINQMMQSQVGSGQADLNARMGAGGFGTSGALASMSGDMQRQAARDAAQQIMGVRGDARDDRLRELQMGLQSNFTDRGLDMSDAQYQQYLNALADTNYDPERVGSAGSDGHKNGDVNSDGTLSPGEIKAWNNQHGQGEGGINDTNHDGVQSHGEASSADFQAPSDAYNYEDWTGDGVPWGIKTGRDGEYSYIMGLDGHLWKVPISAYGQDVVDKDAEPA